MLSPTALITAFTNAGVAAGAVDVQKHTLLTTLWNELMSHPTYQDPATLGGLRWPLGLIPFAGPVQPVGPAEPYTVIAVDGSQIYPDIRGWSLINIGSIVITYGRTTSSATVSSVPSVTRGYQPPEEIDAQRTVAELARALELASQNQVLSGPQLLFFDGPLRFWHEDKQTYFLQYHKLLEVCHTRQVSLVGYISGVKSREVVGQLEKFARATGRSELAETIRAEKLCDADLITALCATNEILGPFYQEPKSSKYAESVNVHAFYYRTAYEIVRLEIPAYIAQNQEARTQIFTQVLDQQEKGFGYPVALAEAHEQAVVSERDRQLFYHLLEQYYPHNQRAYKTIAKQLVKT